MAVQHHNRPATPAGQPRDDIWAIIADRDDLGREPGVAALPPEDRGGLRLESAGIVAACGLLLVVAASLIAP